MGKCKLIIVASDGLIRLLQFTPIDEFRRSLMYLHYLFCRFFFFSLSISFPETLDNSILLLSVPLSSSFLAVYHWYFTISPSI